MSIERFRLFDKFIMLTPDSAHNIDWVHIELFIVDDYVWVHKKIANAYGDGRENE